MLSGWEAPWLHRTERAKARQSKLVTHTFLTVDTPGTPPGTPVCVLVPNRARLGPYGADGRIGRPHRIPGEGRGLGVNEEMFFLKFPTLFFNILKIWS